MRTIKTALGGLAAVGVLAAAAIGASTASAEIAPLSKFVATPKLGQEFVPGLKIKGVGVGPQEFTFKKLTIVCEAAKAHGEVSTVEAETITLKVSYKKCTAGPLVYGNSGKETLGARFREEALLTYHYAGWIESGEEVEIATKHLKCVTDWEEGTYPEKAEEKPLNHYPDGKYSTEEVSNENAKLFPGGKQKKLMITNEVKEKGLEWEEEGEGPCEEFKFSEGEKGKYEGKLLVEVPNGNLEFKEPA
jgi:hypothetical protein